MRVYRFFRAGGGPATSQNLDIIGLNFILLPCFLHSSDSPASQLRKSIIAILTALWQPPCSGGHAATKVSTQLRAHGVGAKCPPRNQKNRRLIVFSDPRLPTTVELLKIDSLKLFQEFLSVDLLIALHTRGHILSCTTALFVDNTRPRRVESL